MTFEDWMALPESWERIEILAGEQIISPTPWSVHQWVVGELLAAISKHLESFEKGVAYTYLGVKLSDQNVIIPDVLVVLAENASRLQKFGVDGPPDLIVEVVSPSTEHVDRGRKVETYQKFGVPEYWIVDPQTETILAHTLVGQHYEPIASDDGLVHSKAIAGLTIDPVSVFAVPDWMPTADS